MNDFTNLPQKHCPKCENDFPPTLEYFHVDKSKKSGLTCYCKKCQSHHKRPRKNPSDLKRHRNTSLEYKWCPGCKQDKPRNLENFHANRSSKDGLTHYCKECGNARNTWGSEHKEEKRLYMQQYCKDNLERLQQYRKEQYQSDTERYKQQTRQYYRNHMEQVQQYMQGYRQTHAKRRLAYDHRRRALKRGNGGIYTEQDIQRQFKAQKGKCYWCGKKLDKYHIDHVVPISRGGSNNPSNLVLSCPPCNCSRKNKLPHEWPEGGRLL